MESARVVAAPMATSILASFSARRTVIAPAKPPARPPESFTSLKQTAEKMLHEQACARSDLEISNAKLARTEEHLRALESKLQESCKENAMLRVKHKEDTKLWTSLESKMSSTSAFFDQITETLNALETQVQQAESTRRMMDDRLRRRDDEIGSAMEKHTKELVDMKAEHDQAMHLMEEKHKMESQELGECSKRAYDALLLEKESALERILERENTSIAMRKSFEMQLEEKGAEMRKSMEDACARNDQVISELKQTHQKELAELSERTNAAYMELVKEKASVSEKAQELERAVELLKKQKDEALSEMKESYEKQLAETIASANIKYECLLKEKESALATLSTANQEDAEQSKLQLEAKEAELGNRLKEQAQQNVQAITEMKEQYEKKLAEMSEATRVKCEELSKERDSVVQKIAALEKETMEVRRQSDLLLEAKQAEVANHMKELSQRNDQALNEIKRHYEKETQEALQKKLADDEHLRQQLESTKCKYEQLLESATLKISVLEKAGDETTRRFELQLEAKQAEICNLTDEVSHLTEQLKDANAAEAPREVSKLVKKPEIQGRSDEFTESEDVVISSRKCEAEAGSNHVQETRMDTRSKKHPPVTDIDNELDPEPLATRGRKRDVERTAEAGDTRLSKKRENKVPISEKRVSAKRKRVQETVGTPIASAASKKRRAAPASRQARSSVSGENDLFGDCLDPYRDDPYVFQ